MAGENARDVLARVNAPWAWDRAHDNEPATHIAHGLRRASLETADNQLAALDAAGFAVVPKLPTVAMIYALQEWAICAGEVGKGYEAMLAAAPDAKPVPDRAS